MKQVLEKLQRKGNPSTLLVGMQTGADTLENSMKFPQKTKDGSVFLCSDLLLGQCSNNWFFTYQLKNLCTLIS